MKWINSPDIDIPYFTFENLEKSGIAVNAFTTRFYKKDGCESSFFQPLLRRDSDPDEVDACIRMLYSQFGTDGEHTVSSAQKHTANVFIVKENSPDVPEGTDGLVTDLPGIMLQTFGADCPSVYLLDPVHKAIGLCHSGRKGTQNQIAAVTLKTMEASYGTRPEDVLAAVSPGICVNCYEVGEDVAEDFLNDYSAFHTENVTENILPFINGKYHINLFEAIRLSLIRAGVSPSSIEISDLCTKCRKDIFYSFRGEGRISSENCALLMLKRA